jgi:hypothetical protein
VDDRAPAGEGLGGPLEREEAVRIGRRGSEPASEALISASRGVPFGDDALGFNSARRESHG